MEIEGDEIRTTGSSPSTCLRVGFIAALVCLAGWFAYRSLDSEGTATQSSSAEAKAASGQILPIVCPEAIWDFGTVDQDKTPEVTHSFRLKNASHQTVGVEKIDASCGCILSDAQPTAIEPGSTANLSVKVQTVRPPGPFQHFVTVRLATLPASKLTLTIRGTIAASPAFRLVPVTLDFGTLGEMETKTRTVRLDRYDGTPAEFLQATPTSEALRVERAQRGDDLDSFVELTVSLDSSLLNAGDFRSSVAVLTGHPVHPDVTIPVKAKISGLQHGLIKSLFVHRLRKGESQDKPLADAGGPAAAVEAVRYEGDGPIFVELLAAEDSGAGRPVATVRVSRNDEPTESRVVVRGHLVVKLIGQEKAVRIPLGVYLSKD